MKKYFGRFVPRKSWFGANGDGDVEHRDFIAAAQKVVGSITPTKDILDVNGDGMVDINDALDVARITGAAIAGAGVTICAGAIAGSVLVTGKATAIAGVIASSIGGAAGAGFGAVLGTTSAVSWGAVQLANGSWILATETVVSSSPTLITALSSAGSFASATSSGIVNAIAGFPVIQSGAVRSLIASKQILVIAGIPVAREVALATGLVAMVVVGGYAYYVLTRKRIEKREVEEAIGNSPHLA
ncbi:MAG: hypothetical protein O3C15_07930 [Proteobacteria bacterium]|nr:hypothetical protein [Pseudomonadota bacterium]